MRKALVAVWAAGISLWGAAAAVAGTNITSFGVSLTVLSRCVVSASNVRCTQSAPFTRTVTSAGYSQLVASNANHRAPSGISSDTITVTISF